MNAVGMDLEKRKCRATIKDRGGQIQNELFFGDDKNGLIKLAMIVLVMKCMKHLWNQLKICREGNT